MTRFVVGNDRSQGEALELIPILQTNYLNSFYR
jgi:hypothetical protein